MTTCVEVYFEDDGSISVAVEQSVVADSPEEKAEQKQPVKSLDEVMQILQSVQGESGEQPGAPEGGAEDAGESFESGFGGVRGAGLGR